VLFIFLTQVDKNLIREFLQYRLLDTVNAGITSDRKSNRFLLLSQKRNWLGLSIRSRSWKTVLQKLAIFSIKISYVIEIDIYHALIFITWLILMLKMSVESQQEISPLMERFVSNQLISRFYNRYAVKLKFEVSM